MHKFIAYNPETRKIQFENNQFEIEQNPFDKGKSARVFNLIGTTKLIAHIDTDSDPNNIPFRAGVILGLIMSSNQLNVNAGELLDNEEGTLTIRKRYEGISTGNIIYKPKTEEIAIEAERVTQELNKLTANEKRTLLFKWFDQIIDQCKLLNDQGIHLNDITPDNIILNFEEKTVRLVDTGNATHKDTLLKVYECTGERFYTIQQAPKKPSLSSDITAGFISLTKILYPEITTINFYKIVFVSKKRTRKMCIKWKDFIQALSTIDPQIIVSLQAYERILPKSRYMQQKKTLKFTETAQEKTEYPYEYTLRTNNKLKDLIRIQHIFAINGMATITKIEADQVRGELTIKSKRDIRHTLNGYISPSPQQQTQAITNKKGCCVIC
ncbi:hypothetical protein DID73_01935 [Candidatus Marinamargulisbacteria bacterium SCGC AG-343-K17]|nr:hypothetical protein DID73_01935 [Candidatus Marinamargulisbacteria bacterium SCGC AG-343-K17]